MSKHPLIVIVLVQTMIAVATAGVGNHAACSVNPGCGALVGDCCPTPQGVQLDCCGGGPVVSASCSSNSACDALGLTGTCCPTPAGVFLDCCGDHGNTGITAPSSFDMSASQDSTSFDGLGSQCSAYSACSDLVGECCPTTNGAFLDCCYDSEDNPPVNNGAECANHPACSALGLDGLCCATEEGVTLDCCNGFSNPHQPQTKQCSAYSACGDLVGDCCPTVHGVFLDCCGDQPPSSSPGPECEKYPMCKALGLDGLCCATAEGVTLECCNGEAGPSTDTKQCSAHASCGGLLGDCCPTEHGVYLDCCRQRDRETPPPTNRLTPPPTTTQFVSIGTIYFDDLPEDSTITNYRGLVWTNFLVSATSPEPPSPPRAAIPKSKTSSFELNSGVFSLVSMDIAGSPSANPIIVKGFDVYANEVVSKSFTFKTVYETYDFSEFTNIAKVEFIFDEANASGLDNLVFV
eukprot:scaffold6992_cov102-Cylindrotheca_fusiformis.AAC.4